MRSFFSFYDKWGALVYVAKRKRDALSRFVAFLMDLLALNGAFVAAWLPGSEGAGIAEVLFGECDFSGKLSFSWPSDGADTLNVGNANYDPLFPRGFGLTY